MGKSRGFKEMGASAGHGRRSGFLSAQSLRAMAAHLDTLSLGADMPEVPPSVRALSAAHFKEWAALLRDLIPEALHAEGLGKPGLAYVPGEFYDLGLRLDDLEELATVVRAAADAMQNPSRERDVALELNTARRD